MPAPSWRTTEKFPGYFHKRDVTQLSPGSLILGSKNVVTGDDDRVGPRSGSTILGTASGSLTPGKSMHSFKKRDGSSILIKSYGTVLEYYHETIEAWQNLSSLYTSGQVFGFADHNTSNDAMDYVYFCNGVEKYSRWTGVYDTLSGTYVGGETSVVIDGSIFSDEVLYSGTASSCTTTTITMPTDTWGTNTWNGFYVLITNGSEVDKVAKITATTSTQITFATIAGLSGTPTFQIRRLRFDDDQMLLRIGSSDVPYSGFVNQHTFANVVGMIAAADGAAVTQGVKQLGNAPRGNILRVMNSRMFVGNVRVSGSYGKPGARSALHYSKINDASDFSFSATRAANEGGIIDYPQRGGPLTALETNEDVMYVFKEDVTYTLTFTQDANDLPQTLPLLGANNVGSVNSLGVVKTDSDIFYVSADSVIRSVKRPEVTDFARPQQLSDPIRKLTDTVTTTNVAGIYHRNKVYYALQSEGSTINDIVLVYDFERRSWYAPFYGWNVAAWEVHNGNLYYLSSVTPDVYMIDFDVYDDSGMPYEAVARFAYDNMGSPEQPKQHDLIFMDMLMSESTTVTITVRYDYLGGTDVRSTTLSGTDTDFLIYSPGTNTLGEHPLGTQPLGDFVDISEAPDDLSRFRFYITSTVIDYHEVSIEVSSYDVGSIWQVVRFGLNPKMQPVPNPNKFKKLA